MEPRALSVFPPIDPDAPLCVAAREVNAYAAEHGADKTLEWIGVQTPTDEIAYLCEQRALRAVAAATMQVDLDSEPDPQLLAAAIVLSPNGPYAYTG